MTRNLREMDKLEAFLKENGIVYERIDEKRKHDIHQIIVYDKGGRRTWDVICQRGSFGVEEGLLEGMGDIFNDAEGWLTAAEIIERIKIQIGRI